MGQTLPMKKVHPLGEGEQDPQAIAHRQPASFLLRAYAGQVGWLVGGRSSLPVGCQGVAQFHHVIEVTRTLFSTDEIDAEQSGMLVGNRLVTFNPFKFSFVFSVVSDLRLVDRL